MKSLFFPKPQRLDKMPGEWKPKDTYTVYVPEELEPVFQTILKMYTVPALPLLKAEEYSADITLKSREGHGKEGYSLLVGQETVQLEYSEPAGAFYGLITLCQMLLQSEDVPCCHIEDYPGLKLRGVMMDISRGKVPAMSTLKQVVDRLAQFKINHFELYIEGWAYAYPSYQKFWEKETPMTPEEFRELDSYCKERFIDLVPCQNGLGHMGQWLANRELRTLAECEDGFTVKGHTFPPTTLDVSDERALQFVGGLFDGLLPCFESKLCNTCLDEPFELCMGKNKEKSEEKYRLYADYANRLNGLLKDKGRQMMMWGDVLAKDDEVLSRLDQDIMILDWGYEKEHPAAKRAERLAASGHSFCLCPGTNSWLSFTGMTDNMLTCIKNTAAAAWKYGAEGMIVTDWGDMGHLQYLPVSWAGILTAAAFCWNENGTDERQLAEALNRFVFMDKAEVMGQLCLDAGRYYKYEEFCLPCRTLASTVLSTGLVTKENYERNLEFTARSITFFSQEDFCSSYIESYENRKPMNEAELAAFLEEISQRLLQSDLHCADGEIVVAEYKNALNMVKIMTGLRAVMEKGASTDGIGKCIDETIAEHRKLWNYRNKRYGCEEGLRILTETRERIS